MHPNMNASSDIEENLSLQAYELEALSAILCDDIKFDAKNSFSIKICNNFGNEVFLQIRLPEMYPLNSAPQYELSAPWMNRETKEKLYAEMEEVYKKNAGESIVYAWVEAIKDFVEGQTISETNSEEPDSEISYISTSNDMELPIIEHGETIVDRKSVFQAHLARINSESQIQLVLNKLKENSKIAEATHNVYAYRILLENGQFNQDYDDDKEAKAGSVLLHLLQVSNLSNIMVIVTRWYGGIHLGHYRFRHYKNAAKNLISNLDITEVKKTDSSRCRRR